MNPHRGVRIPGPQVHIGRNPDQDEQREWHRDQPPQMPHELAVHHPRCDKRRKVRRVGHLMRPVDPAPAEPFDPRDDLAHDVVANRLVQRVTRVVKAVVRVQLVAVLDPHLSPVCQEQVRLQAQPRSGQLSHGVRRLDVPGQVAVVVADDVDDLPAAFGYREQRRGQVVVRAQDVGGGRLAVTEQLDDVPGQHDRQRSGGRCQPRLREPPDQGRARPSGDVGPRRRQVQIADHDDMAVGRHGHVEQVGDLWSRRGHASRVNGRQRLEGPGHALTIS